MYCPLCKVEYRAGFERCASCDVQLVDAAPDWSYLETWPTSALICTPFLDSDVREITRAADTVLASRGVGIVRRALYRGMAGCGLLGLVVVGGGFILDEEYMDMWEVIAGYSVTVVLGAAYWGYRAISADPAVSAFS